MPRSLWTGTISFGLVSIPVSIISAKEQESLSFNMLDKRDYGRIGYKTINKSTGREVTRDQIVKAYQYEPDQFVVVTDKDFERANPKATQTIDIEDFVRLDDLDPLMMEKPYYLVPAKHGEKGYLLLKKVLDETKKIAIGRFVLRQKQKLVALMPRGDHLVLEVLRYAREVLSPRELDHLTGKVKNVHVTPKELEMAEALVKNMSAKWNPEKYRDTYTEDLRSFIQRKAKGGEAVESEAPPAEPLPHGKVVDLMPLLKKSLEYAGHAGATAEEPKAARAGKRAARKGGGHRPAAGARTKKKPAQRHVSAHTH